MNASIPRIASVFATLLLAAACGGGGGGSSSPAPNPPPAQSTFTDPNSYSSAATAALATPNENTSVTRHTLTVNGTPLAYTATAGHLTARTLGAATGEARASFFYVAYTLDGAAPATRPVTFFYNGGPGSATVWLHLGSFGPKRLDARAPLHNGPQPFPLVDNAETLLDTSDLVFVDAVGTGFSQAIAPNANSAFWSVATDATVFRDFVMRYVIANQREASPKFLFGESYGTARAAVHARLLEQAGMSVRGVVLQSSVLDYLNNCGVAAAPTVRCTGYVPSYAATAHWFQNTPGRPNVSSLALDDYLVEARTLATRDYDPAVAQWLATQQAPDPALVGRLAATTGIGAAHWNAQFNMGPGYYRVNYWPGTLLGRYDSRVTLQGSTNPSNDPSSSAISNSFASGITSYLSNTLLFTTPSSYMMLSNAIQAWGFAYNGRPVPDTVPDLAVAMTLNPRLQVLVASGVHDLATPFLATEQDLARLGANNPNVTIKNYVGGHMTYLDDTTRVRQRADLGDFYRRAVQ